MSKAVVPLMPWCSDPPLNRDEVGDHFAVDIGLKDLQGARCPLRNGRLCKNEGECPGENQVTPTGGESVEQSRGGSFTF